MEQLIVLPGRVQMTAFLVGHVTRFSLSFLRFRQGRWRHRGGYPAGGTVGECLTHPVSHAATASHASVPLSARRMTCDARIARPPQTYTGCTLRRVAKS